MLSDKDIRQGFFFGINSGVITTAGLITGLSQSVSNPIYIIISVLSVAISDGLGEAYGIYLSKKAKDIKDISNGPILSFISLLISKIFIVTLFLLPLLFDWNIKYFQNLYWTIIYSSVIILILDYKLSKLRNEKITDYLVQHLVVLFLVILATKYIGIFLSKYINE